MIKSFDSREITHLRYLADAIAVKPSDASALISIVASVAKQCPDFTQYLMLLKEDVRGSSETEIRELAILYQQSGDSAACRIGEILEHSFNYYDKKRARG